MSAAAAQRSTAERPARIRRPAASSDEAPLLRPFFPFFGSKWRTAPYYPSPEERLIIEPFAGSAGYSTRFHEREVLLIDRDPVIVGVWQYLIKVAPAELLRIPDVREHIDELADWPEEARWLVGFWLGRSCPRPQLRPSAWNRTGQYPDQFWGESVRRRLAAQVDKIRHWRVLLGSYECAPAGKRATWFVDAPYHGKAGRRYRGGHQGINYEELAGWCKRLPGLVVACEQSGARWLPFQTFRRTRTTHATACSDEVVWISRDRSRQTCLHLVPAGASRVPTLTGDESHAPTAPAQRHPLLIVAARGAAGVQAGLVVRVRPARAFERASWADCPPDGLRVSLDEDGTVQQNAELATSLPWAGFVSSSEWQALLVNTLSELGQEQHP